MRLFEDDELCIRFSKRVIQDAEQRHDRERNYQQLLEIYDELLREKKNEQCKS
jgi:hypothetical protein